MRPPGASESRPPPPRQMNGVLAPIGGVGAPLGEPGGLELVDDRHHRARVDQRPGHELLLSRARVRRRSASSRRNAEAATRAARARRRTCAAIRRPFQESRKPGALASGSGGGVSKRMHQILPYVSRSFVLQMIPVGNQPTSEVTVAPITRWVLAHKRIVTVFWIALTLVGIASAELGDQGDGPEVLGSRQGGLGDQREDRGGFHGTGGDNAPIVPVVTLPHGADGELARGPRPARPGRSAARAGAPRARASPRTPPPATGRFVSPDGRTTFAIVYPQPGSERGLRREPGAAKAAERRSRDTTVAGAPVHVTGFDALQNAAGGDSGRACCSRR